MARIQELRDSLLQPRRARHSDLVFMVGYVTRRGWAEVIRYRNYIMYGWGHANPWNARTMSAREYRRYMNRESYDPPGT